jgi:hypothetical protein
VDKSETPLPPKDYLDALEGVKGLFIVGGQAVNLWAEVLLTPEETLKLGPFTSYDIDFFGTSDTVLEIAQATGWRPAFAPHNTASPVIARFEGKTATGNTLVIEVLHSLYGIAPDEMAKPIALKFDGRTYRTLSPPTLLKAKLANCAGLDQTERDDVRQTGILIACVGAYLKLAIQSTERGETSERALINVLESVRDICADHAHREVAVKFKLRLDEVFPAELASTELIKVQRFCKHRLPGVIDALRQEQLDGEVKRRPNISTRSDMPEI